MTQDPNPDIFSPDVVQEMIGKPLQIAAPESVRIKMEAPGVLGDSADANLKFRKEVLA